MLLFRDHPVYAFFDRAPGDELVDQHIASLADAERAVGRLVLNRRVPPAIEVNDVRSCRQVEPRTARLQRQDEERRPVLVLKTLHQQAAALDAGGAVQAKARPAEDRRQALRQRIDNLAELSENQRLLLPLSEFFANLRQPQEFAAVVWAKFAIAEKLTGVVADLLQAQ